MDIHGAGYRVAVPLDVWERLEENTVQKLFITSYIREDRFDLFGFLESETKKLFDEFIGISGIGPKTALELCGVPRGILSTAIMTNDPTVLTEIKGIGRKTAEKLLLELKSLAEKYPAIFSEKGSSHSAHRLDPDAVAALEILGYDAPTIRSALQALPKDLVTTEERVTAALRSL